jgi:hypothetical protein
MYSDTIEICWLFTWGYDMYSHWAIKKLFSYLTLILLMWKIGWAPNNASRWQMGFNSAFKRLNLKKQRTSFLVCIYKPDVNIDSIIMMYGLLMVWKRTDSRCQQWKGNTADKGDQNTVLRNTSGGSECIIVDGMWRDVRPSHLCMSTEQVRLSNPVPLGKIQRMTVNKHI